MNPEFGTLQALLKRRLQLIADPEFREVDPTGHLAALQQVSELITSEHHRLRSVLPGRLSHFLQQASFGKALDFLEQSSGLGSGFPQEH
jgi:hypothetical protein